MSEHDERPSGYIEHEGTLTEAEAEDLKRRFLEAQTNGTPMRIHRLDEPTDGGSGT